MASIVVKPSETRVQNAFGPSFQYCVVAQYDRKKEEWSRLKVVKTDHAKINIDASIIHYGQGIFEGGKAHWGIDGSFNVFRQEDNWRRFCKSAARMSMPEVSRHMFSEALSLVISRNKEQLPERNPLYIRPFQFNNSRESSPGAGNSFLFSVIVKELHVPSAPGMKVWVEPYYSRACVGGAGDTKAVCNYGTALEPEAMAKAHGCERSLWLDAKEHQYIEEFSTMNFFAVTSEGVLWSPKPGSTVINGITRSTLLVIAKEKGISVDERPMVIGDLIDGIASKRIVGIFGTGTASIIIPCNSIKYGDIEYSFDSLPVFRELTNEINAAYRGESYTTQKWLHKVHF